MPSKMSPHQERLMGAVQAISERKLAESKLAERAADSLATIIERKRGPDDRRNGDESKLEKETFLAEVINCFLKDGLRTMDVGSTVVQGIKKAALSYFQKKGEPTKRF